MAQFTIYRSSDGGAPALDGTVGSLVNLLTTVLTGPSFNGTGFAYGATPCAGWSRAFTGTDKAVYRPGAGTRLYLRVQDDAPITAKEARITGYESMSDVDTGTGPFPTAVQGLSGSIAALALRKSATANSTARSWIIFADNRTAYIFILTGDDPGLGDPWYYGSAFGDFYSFKSDDAYNCLIIGRTADNSLSNALNHIGQVATSLSATVPGHFFARGHDQMIGSVAFGKHVDGVKNGASVNALGVVPFTNPEDGGIYMAPCWIHDPTTAPVNGCRGRMRGFWVPLHAEMSLPFGTTFSGGASGELAGKTFEAITEVPYNGANGTVVIETSNSVETN